MAHFPATLSRVESDRLIDRVMAGFARHGFGLWAVERRRDGALLGFTGLSVPSFEAPFMPAVEIAWRLAAPAWGQGYAVEAARAALAFGFDVAGLEAVFAFTTPANLRSLALMQRLGMQQVEDGAFDHPVLPPRHLLRRHLLYRINPDRFARFSGGA